MRERAMDAPSGQTGHRQAARDAQRFSPLLRLGYKISGRDEEGFTATDPASGKVIRRLTFKAFDKAVQAAGLTRSSRSQLLAKRATSEYRLREQVENQRLQLLAMESRELRNG